MTVDVDHTCVAELAERLRSDGRKHIHHTTDALDPDLPKIVSGSGVIEAAICNPPYIRPEWRPGFEHVLSDAGLLNAFTSPREVTADVLFLAQTVRVTTVGGTIGLIVPDGIITGVKNGALRKALLSKHRIRAVVQLPRKSFKDAEVQAFILIFGNGARPGKTVTLMRYDNETGLSEPLLISRERAEHRMDYDFHNSIILDNSLRSLSDVGGTVSRGNITADQARRADIPAFHTTDFNRADGSVSFDTRVDQQSVDRKLVTVEAHDILVARVDRNLHRKVAIVTAGQGAITDCVYRIRVPQHFVRATYMALRSEVGAQLLFAAARGVSARQLSKLELLNLPLLPLTASE